MTAGSSSTSATRSCSWPWMPAAGCAIAGEITAAYAEGIEPRGGVAFGDVITRHGDYYGTVVNLASRLAELAVPGEVLVERGRRLVGRARRFAFRPAGRRLLKGFDEPLEVFSLDCARCAGPYQLCPPAVPHPRIDAARPLPLARRGQRRWHRLPPPAGRHRHQYPFQERNHLGPDDLRPADLPDVPSCRTVCSPAFSVARLAGHPSGRGVRRAWKPRATGRFIKTHTPLDGLPLDPGCTYIVTGRASRRHGRVPVPPGGEPRPRTGIRQLLDHAEPETPPAPPTAMHRWLLSWMAEDAHPRVLPRLASRGDVAFLRCLGPPQHPNMCSCTTTTCPPTSGARCADWRSLLGIAVPEGSGRNWSRRPGSRPCGPQPAG